MSTSLPIRSLGGILDGSLTFTVREFLRMSPVLQSNFVNHELEKWIQRIPTNDNNINVSGIQKLNFWDVPRIKKGMGFKTFSDFGN